MVESYVPGLQVSHDCVCVCVCVCVCMCVYLSATKQNISKVYPWRNLSGQLPQLRLNAWLSFVVSHIFTAEQSQVIFFSELLQHALTIPRKISRSSIVNSRIYFTLHWFAVIDLSATVTFTGICSLHQDRFTHAPLGIPPRFGIPHNRDRHSFNRDGFTYTPHTPLGNSSCIAGKSPALLRREAVWPYIPHSLFSLCKNRHSPLL